MRTAASATIEAGDPRLTHPRSRGEIRKTDGLTHHGARPRAARGR